MKFNPSISDKASFLHASILASNDGLVTTFAVIAGSLGANLDPKVIVILGVANLFADGFSMASGNYLGAKSEEEYETAQHQTFKKSPAIANGIVTFVAFIIAGVLPVFPYFFKIQNQFEIAVTIMATSLICIGISEGFFTDKNPIYTGARSLVIGGIAAAVAFAVGVLLKGIPL